VRRDALVDDFLLRVGNATESVELVIVDRRAGQQAGDQPMATARIAPVLGIVGAQPEQRAVVPADLRGNPPGQHVLLVIVLAGREILAETVPRQARHGCADPEHIDDRIGGGDDAIQLPKSPRRAAHLEPRIVGKTPSDIFDGAADGVAAVESALRPAQDLDPFDVVNVQDRALRTVEVDVIEIEADPLLEAGDRVLLADAADEGGQGRVCGARRFNRDVGRGVADVGDVRRAFALELGAAVGGNGDRHVLQPFVAAPGGDRDAFAARFGVRLFRRGGGFGGGDFRFRRWRGVLCGGLGTDAGQRERRAQKHRTCEIDPAHI
jgi:hypothetical protein